MAKKKKLLKQTKNLITRIDDVPVTHREIKVINKQLASLKISIDKRFDSVDKRFDSMDKRFDSIDKRFDSMIDLMDSRFARISAENQRWLALYEEQNARNKVVMDSQAMTQHKFEEFDSRISSLEEKVHGIKHK